jgi:hypothetical protein
MVSTWALWKSEVGQQLSAGYVGSASDRLGIGDMSVQTI